MKKILLLTLLLPLGLLCSCVGPTGPAGLPGRDGQDGITVMKTVLIDVDFTKWVYSGDEGRADNNYFYATVPMEEITRDIYKVGVVKMYRVWNFNSTDGWQMEMPYTRHIEIRDGDDQYKYTETVDYEFQVGQITIYYTANDFDYEWDDTFIPESMQFRCVIFY